MVWLVLSITDKVSLNKSLSIIKFILFLQQNQAISKHWRIINNKDKQTGQKPSPFLFLMIRKLLFSHNMQSQCHDHCGTPKTFTKRAIWNSSFYCMLSLLIETVMGSEMNVVTGRPASLPLSPPSDLVVYAGTTMPFLLYLWEWPCYPTVGWPCWMTKEAVQFCNSVKTHSMRWIYSILWIYIYTHPIWESIFIGS